jgi:hypothetical protein
MAPRRSVHVPQGNGNNRFVVVVLALGLIVAVGAYMLARSDQGAIDVSATITNANTERQAQTGGESTGVEVIPEVFQNMPNGGLVPQDSNQQPTPAPEPASNETSTDSSATTTEEGTEGETEDEGVASTENEVGEEPPRAESNGTE